MATQTPNFKFDLRESADIFNPLSTNANFESLDTILKNLQETGGITTYTTTAAANLLKLSGTPKVNDTVFKFVAAGDANTWTGATGGVINNIVALDGKQVTIKGGNMYVAWVNSANAMVVVAWPAVVDAKTFDGKGPDEWASKAQLDAVNQTAANATQTAQAAANVANNALSVARAAGLKMKLLWEQPNWNGYLKGSDSAEEFTITLSENLNDGDLVVIIAGWAISGSSMGGSKVDTITEQYTHIIQYNSKFANTTMILTPSQRIAPGAYSNYQGGRQYTFTASGITCGRAVDDRGSTSSQRYGIPLRIYKITPQY